MSLLPPPLTNILKEQNWDCIGESLTNVSLMLLLEWLSSIVVPATSAETWFSPQDNRSSKQRQYAGSPNSITPVIVTMPIWLLSSFDSSFEVLSQRREKEKCWGTPNKLVGRLFFSFLFLQFCLKSWNSGYWTGDCSNTQNTDWFMDIVEKHFNGNFQLTWNLLCVMLYSCQQQFKRLFKIFPAFAHLCLKYVFFWDESEMVPKTTTTN